MAKPGRNFEGDLKAILGFFAVKSEFYPEN
jgi:hypothetical protein